MKVKVTFFICFLFPFAFVSIYNQPAIDDFWSANTIVDHGRIGAMIFYFQTISGRFFANLLMGLLNTLPAGSIAIFKVWPIAILLLLFGSFYFLYKSVPGLMLSPAQTLTAALMCLVLHVANIRVLFEGLYWMSASICYQVAIGVFAVGIGSVLRCITNHSQRFGALAVLCSFLVAGSAETLQPVYIIILVCLLIICYKRGLNTTPIAVSLLAALAGLAVVFISKGNNLRIGDTSRLSFADALQALYYSGRAVGYYWLYWLATPLNLAAIFLALPFVQAFVRKSNMRWKVKSFHIFLATLLLFGLCATIYFPQLLFEAKTPSPRLTTLVFFFTSHAALLLVCFAVANWHRLQLFISWYSGFKHFKVYAWTLFFICAFTSTNFRWVTEDLVSGSALAYNIEANRRSEHISGTISDTVYVDRFENWPHFIQISKKENYSFDHMSKFYGKAILYSSR